MVGDRAPDVIAGAAFGLQTALVGDVAAEERAALAARDLTPTFEGRDLRDFAAHVSARGSSLRAADAEVVRPACAESAGL